MLFNDFGVICFYLVLIMSDCEIVNTVLRRYLDGIEVNNSHATEIVTNGVLCNHTACQSII